MHAAAYGWAPEQERQHSEFDAPRAQAAAETWDDNGEVIIELGAPQTGDSPAYWSQNEQEEPPHTAEAPLFRPRPPQDQRQSGRRMPEVADFPDFAQAAYHAKRSDSGSSTRTATGAPESARKRAGLFDFLTGRKGSDSTAAESATDDWRAEARRTEPREINHNDESRSQRRNTSEPAVSQTRRIPMPRHRPR